MKKICFFALFVFLVYFVSALEYPEPYDYYVNDYALIFTQEEKAYLQSIFNEVFLNTTAEVVVVTLPTLNGSDISQYTIGLANEWRVGKSDKDNGVVILYALEENKIFVATGYGIEGILPDSKIGRMLDTYYVPLRDEGNVTLGILVFSNELKEVMLENGAELVSGARKESSGEVILIIIISILGFFFTVAILSYFAGNRRNRGVGDFTAFFLADVLIRSVLIGKSSSSGSFGGFGGGSFGGGGAGR